MAERFPYFEFFGSHRQIGRQHGRQAGEYIYKHLDMAFGKLESKHIDRQMARERAKTYIPFIERYTPHFADELAGLADGAEIPIEDAYVLQLRAELAVEPGLDSSSLDAARAREEIAHECTTFAVSGELTADNIPIAGQNADLPAGTKDVGIVVKITPEDRPELLMLTPAGQISYIGINDRGMSVFANFLNTDGWRPGFPRYLLSRLALEQDNVQDAVERIESVPRASSRNILMMDSSGNAVDLELAVQAHSQLDPENGVLVHSNHFVNQRMSAEERAEPDRHANSCKRLERIHELIEAQRNELSPESAMEIFRDRANAPDAICRHLGDGPTDYITFASVFARPSLGELYVAPGPPDSHEYTRYIL